MPRRALALLFLLLCVGPPGARAADDPVDETVCAAAALLEEPDPDEPSHVPRTAYEGHVDNLYRLAMWPRWLVRGALLGMGYSTAPWDLAWSIWDANAAPAYEEAGALGRPAVEQANHVYGSGSDDALLCYFPDGRISVLPDPF